MKMDFEKKSIEDVGKWLKDENFSEKVVQDFASKSSSTYSLAREVKLFIAICWTTIVPHDYIFLQAMEWTERHF